MRRDVQKGCLQCAGRPEGRVSKVTEVTAPCFAQRRPAPLYTLRRGDLNRLLCVWVLDSTGLKLHWTCVFRPILLLANRLFRICSAARPGGLSRPAPGIFGGLYSTGSENKHSTVCIYLLNQKKIPLYNHTPRHNTDNFGCSAWHSGLARWGKINCQQSYLSPIKSILQFSKSIKNKSSDISPEA